VGLKILTIVAEENKRGAPRARVLKGAKILALDRWTVVDCTVRDISETGAKLLCGDPMAIANEVRFLLPTENTIRNARVVWRRETMIGIEFTSEKTRAPARKV
jgi:PilZ domain